MDLKQKSNTLINRDGSIKSHDAFTFTEGKNKGKRLQIIASESTGFSVYETIDMVKNLENNKVTELSRVILKELNPIIV